MVRLVVATGNPGKFDELRALLEPFALRLQAAWDLALPSPAETGDTYLANATIKAVLAARSTGALVLGDDGGLAIDVLGGAPGLHTARYTARLGGTAAACAELAARVRLIADPTAEVRATLHCALALADPRGALAAASAEIPGRLCWPPVAAPGLAAIFAPDPPRVLVEDGVLVHRRVAFERLVPALRAALAGAVH